MKAFLKSISLFIASTLVSAFLGELAVRLVVPQRLDNNVAIYENDERLVFRMRKNFEGVYSNFEFSTPIVLSSIGIRNKEVGPKQEDVLRIIGVGDSFTFGNGVTGEETYLSQLESCLQHQKGTPAEVINCAVPAYSPLQEARFFQRMDSTLHSDVVIMGFFVGNDIVESGDLFDSVGVPTVRVENGGLVSNKPSDEERSLVRRITRPIRFYLSTRSHMYVFLRNRSSELLSAAGLHPFNLPPDFCAKNPSQRIAESWKLTKSILKDFATYTRDRSKRLIVVILPTSYQVYESSWKAYIAALKINPEDYDLDMPQRILGEFFEKEDIEFVDMLPILRKVDVLGPRLFYPIDGHLTPEGHKYVAQTLCRYLADSTHSAVAARH